MKVFGNPTQRRQRGSPLDLLRLGRLAHRLLLAAQRRLALPLLERLLVIATTPRLLQLHSERVRSSPCFVGRHGVVPCSCFWIGFAEALPDVRLYHLPAVCFLDLRLTVWCYLAVVYTRALDVPSRLDPIHHIWMPTEATGAAAVVSLSDAQAVEEIDATRSSGSTRRQNER